FNGYPLRNSNRTGKVFVQFPRSTFYVRKGNVHYTPIQQAQCRYYQESIDNTSVLAYEVVRDTPDSYEKLMSKLERYYNLIHSEIYLDSNYHGDASYPEMIICGESRDHNIKIAEYLRANGMWSQENTILFTEDLLNMKRSLVSIYALADDNTQNWY